MLYEGPNALSSVSGTIGVTNDHGDLGTLMAQSVGAFVKLALLTHHRSMIGEEYDNGFAFEF